MTKLHTKSILTALTLAVILSLGPSAFGQVKMIIAGSSGMFNAMALGAYNNGSCPKGGVSPCAHWTGKTSMALQDTRVTPPNNDSAKVFVVWDSSTVVGGPDIWVYANVDSVVGDRCYFAVPACKLIDTSGTNAGWTTNLGSGSLVSAALWGNDTAMPAAVLNIVEASGNMAVNVGATDIRPEDAWFAMNRVNSALGASTAGGSNSDGLDGLGYNANNAAGIAPNYVTSTTGACTGLTNAKAVGTPIYSAFQNTGTTTDASNVLAFNILGKDPITCTAIPTYSVKSIGADPIVFVFSRTNELAGLTNASEQQLQQVFSGTNTDASAFGLPTGNINAFLREPTSGTMNTTEATVFRLPTLYSSNSALAQNVAGLSQETGVGTPTGGTANNPLAKAAAGGSGWRFRSILSGEEVTEVLCSALDTNSACKGGFSNSLNAPHDGIGYAFFSYGNVSPLGDNAAYGYITLNGVDPVFTSYQGIGDPAQPNPSSYGGLHGVLPLTGENGLTLPQCENALWKYGYSFPNVRNGTYRAWSILRLVYPSSQSTNVTNLATTANTFVVTSTPDYVPFSTVTVAAGGACGSKAFTDSGVKVWRSHYQQLDGSNRALGAAPVNTNTADKGGDMGGAILIYEATLGVPDTTTQLVQSDTQSTNPTNVNLSPALRPAK